MFPYGAHQLCLPQSIPGWKPPAPFPQSQVVVLIVEPTLPAHQHSEYEEADGLRMSSLHHAPVIGSHLSVSQVSIGILQETAVLMSVIHISIHLSQCRCIYLPSGNEGIDFYRLDKEEGNHPPEPFSRKITQWDENQSIDGIGEEDVTIEEGGVHDTEHRRYNARRNIRQANLPEKQFPRCC